MNKPTNRICSDNNNTDKYTILIARIVISLILSYVIVYIYISSTNNYNLLLLTDDIAYATRSSVIIGIIGLLVVRYLERREEH